MSRSFRRDIRHREKTARRNNPVKRTRGVDPILEIPKTQNDAFEIAPTEETGGFRPAMIELIGPVRDGSTGEITPATYRVLAGSPQAYEIEAIEKVVADINAKVEDFIPPA